MNKQRKRGFSVKPEGRILIEQKMRDKGYNRDKLAEVAEISIDTINSLVRGENKERKTIEAVARALDIQLIDIVDAGELYPQIENITKDNTNINWVQVCHKMLEEQQEQQRIRRKASAMGYEVNVHVPLGLVERKQQQRRNENVERKEIYQLEPEVISKTYQHQDFLQEVINKGYQGKNKHIAIVGEPGAGKTTLLNAIASDIKDKNQKLPIFISLGSLQGMTLADFILKEWLPDAIRLMNIVPTSEIEAQLETEFYQGNFCLLLDGVDEMGESSPIQALNKISQELTSWLGQARVILTCRLNVWDATVNNNILPGFNTFKTQEFNPEQVNTFIAEWFQVANNINGGEKLIAQLQEEGKERIRELVTNPLRLCLLCQIFDRNDQGELPETKAQFYEIFTRYFYEWKPKLVSDLIKSDQLREELHRALGNLALAGINSDVRFRLKRSFVVKEMRNEKLFNLACEVGWLNHVDRDAVNDEDVYAFFHPNFQEYFAALVIDDWHYFLNHVSDNPDEGVYRIFESQWKEVILIWLGQEKDEDFRQQKEDFIKELIYFKDFCGDFYSHRAYLIVASGIVEFKNCSLDYEIAKINSNIATVFSEKVNILMDSSDSKLNKSQIAQAEDQLLAKLSPGNDKAIQNLIHILSQSKAESDHGLSIIITSLNDLGKIAKGSDIAFDAVLNFIINYSSSHSAYLKHLAWLTLGEINKDMTVYYLGRLIDRNYQNKIAYHHYTEILALVDPQDSWKVYYTLAEMLKSQDEITIERALDTLSNMVNINPEVIELSGIIDIIITILENINLDENHISAAICLIHMPINLYSSIVKKLKKCLSRQVNYTDDPYFEIFNHCAQNMTYPDFYRTWHGEIYPRQQLENQFTDTHSHLSQLQPTEKTYPLTLNLKTLQDETDISAIAQKICNQIYPRFFHENLEIPQVNNAPQLERIILQVRNYLKKENIALIINNCEPHQEMIKFCNKLTDVLHIAFITKEHLDAPLKGFPNQPNLLNVIQHWINEIG
ncbi:NACHT C-terminal alpha/beta 1 domain-containing protein [Anabaena sp. WA102]|uniref:NACHT C-terminal alpha/beta 1 domain-containing protein n=1 Tax=Anabaena sp. WA102 TaxID=1647413 RepID=UPI00190181E8|nr:NACHT domain-containing protein [Anabaena sp. WA102]